MQTEERKLFPIKLKKIGGLHFNPFMPSGFFYFNSLDRFTSYIRGVWF